MFAPNEIIAAAEEKRKSGARRENMPLSERRSLKVTAEVTL
jgi:hypothetical protein